MLNEEEKNFKARLSLPAPPLGQGPSCSPWSLPCGWSALSWWCSTHSAGLAPCSWITYTQVSLRHGRTGLHHVNEPWNIFHGASLSWRHPLGLTWWLRVPSPGHSETPGSRHGGTGRWSHLSHLTFGHCKRSNRWSRLPWERLSCWPFDCREVQKWGTHLDNENYISTNGRIKRIQH